MKKTVLMLLVAALATSASHAQQKIGHLNSLDILQSMPEFKQMTDALEKKKADYQGMMEKMYTEYETKQKELQVMANSATQQDAIFEAKVQELQDLQKRIQDFQDKVENDLQKQQTDLMRPINDKYLKTVKEVAKENGYSYVIDIVSGAVAYFPEDSNDITDLVLKKMGLTRQVNSNSGNSQNTGKGSSGK